jgi:hypothetical protein
MDIKLKTPWIYQGKKYNPGDVAKNVPAHVIENIKKTVPPVEFEEVKSETKAENKAAVK